MRHALFTIVWLLCCLGAPGGGRAADALAGGGAGLAARVERLLAEMTLAEKIGQLVQSDARRITNAVAAHAAGTLDPLTGFYTWGPADPERRNAIQRIAVESSRLGIPALFGADVLHGYRVIFPIPLAQACAWDDALVRRAAAAAAREAAAAGVDLTYAPMVDVALDPRWGRVAEGFGEAPWAQARFGAAAVRGFQGDDPAAPDRIAACVKHFAAYGAAEGGRDYSATDVSPQRLWEVYLPPFEACVQAGALAVMSAFNDLNGVPMTANRALLTGVLRERWGFDGLVISDWGAVAQLEIQGAAGDGATAAALALGAGTDVDMNTGRYAAHLPTLVEQGAVSMATLDTAVRRVLLAKLRRGLFERPYVAATPAADPAPADLALADELAAASFVLLKNERGVLPIARTNLTLAVIGPLADQPAAWLGAWKQQGRTDEALTLVEGLRARLPAGVRLRVERGCDLDERSRRRRDVPANSDGTSEWAAALAAARAADVVILCLGESAGMTGENASRSSLRLPGEQEALALAVAACGRPTVLTLVAGRPLELQRIEPAVQAILLLWQPGTRGGLAAADTLLGRRNPAGRLAITFPRTTGQIPLYHYMRPRARRGRMGEYQDLPTTPLYDFGHGLAYTTFAADSLRLDRNSLRPGETLRAELRVTNTGARSGVETVFWMLRRPPAVVTPPLRELRHVERAELAPGASRLFGFELDPARDCAVPDADGRPRLLPGEYTLLVAGQTATFRLITAAD